ncbi:MAG: D-amino acid dehydrogenase [Usitatibacter sp.]
MKVLVLGAGVVGTAAAWYLVERGHEVTVVDRRPAAGMETSFANGGQVSASHPEPWASPESRAKAGEWMRRDDLPVSFRLRWQPAQWMWAWKFLQECKPGRVRENTAQIASLATYSHAMLKALRASEEIEYDALTRGILHYYTDSAVFDAAAVAAPLLKQYGIDRAVKTREEAIAIEPALAQAGERIVGATFAAGDESGDAHKFTRELARLAQARGVCFLYDHDIQAIDAAGGDIVGVLVRTKDMKDQVLTAHAYVVALGSHSPDLAGPVGVNLPVYPAKGHSITVEITDASKAPNVSLTDEEARLVVSRLGNRLRIAGMAEIAGYEADINPARIAAIVRRAREIFPGVGDYDSATPWAGMRPATPSNVPIIGRTGLSNLYVNTGHGTLGWTLACGSGAALADIISGRKPEVDFRFT